MKIPCHDCLMLGLCRHKQYFNLFEQCSLLTDYQPKYFSPYKHERRSTVLELVELFKPTAWNYVPKDDIILRKG